MGLACGSGLMIQGSLRSILLARDDHSKTCSVPSLGSLRLHVFASAFLSRKLFACVTPEVTSRPCHADVVARSLADEPPATGKDVRTAESLGCSFLKDPGGCAWGMASRPPRRLRAHEPFQGRCPPPSLQHQHLEGLRVP